MLKAFLREDRRDTLLSLGFLLLVSLLLMAGFDTYYDLNDDMVIKDIVAGIYTLTPNGHNIQMLYPLGWVLALLYQMSSLIPWYAVFLVVCHGTCLVLLTRRVLGITQSKYGKGLLLFLELLLITSLFLRELIFVQYTVTASMLAGTAAFLWYTAPETNGYRAFFKVHATSLVLVVLAFCIRTEMLLLVFPLVGLAAFCKWMKEKKPFCLSGIVRNIGMLLFLVTLFLLCTLIHKINYSSPEWKEFNRFFNARTQVYDFYGIPPFDGNEKFYESLGIGEATQQLLVNYNFGLEKEINVDTLEKIEKYSRQLRDGAGNVKVRLKTALWDYRERLFGTVDAPFTICVVAAYMLLVVFGVLGHKKDWIWQLILLFSCRSSLWLYILYGGRAPQRITQSLYLVEFMILLAFILEEVRVLKKTSRLPHFTAGIVLSACALVYLPSSVKLVLEEGKLRDVVLADAMAVDKYGKDNPDHYYFLDVYSTIYGDYSFCEKMFRNVDNSWKNYDIMGGWVSKSPLNQEVYKKLGITDLAMDLLEQDNLFVISEAGRMDGWLEAYYKEKGISVQAIPVDSIERTAQKEFFVYRMIKRGERSDR